MHHRVSCKPFGTLSHSQRGDMKLDQNGNVNLKIAPLKDNSVDCLNHLLYIYVVMMHFIQSAVTK